jgi:hypothetical protein
MSLFTTNLRRSVGAGESLVIRAHLERAIIGPAGSAVGLVSVFTGTLLMWTLPANLRT